MTDRLAAALAELAEAIRAEVVADLARDAGAPERLYSIPEAAEVLGIGRTRLYHELMAGRCRSIVIGRRRLVPASALAAYTGAPA